MCHPGPTHIGVLISPAGHVVRRDKQVVPDQPPVGALLPVQSAGHFTISPLLLQVASRTLR